MFVSRVLQQIRKSVNPLNFLDAVGDVSWQKTAGKGHTVKVAVEGNIGSGKTTFLEGCKQFLDTTVLIEPVNIWRDMQGQNLLELMYRDPKRWSLAFQTYVQLTMMQLHLAPVHTPVKLMERSLQSARYVFVENLYHSGHMTALELSILDQWFNWITKNVAVELDMIIYLRTSPQVAMSRILKRKRHEEAELPFTTPEDAEFIFKGKARENETVETEDWLCRVHDLHEQWLLDHSQFPLPPKVMVLDANRDCTDIQRDFLEHLPDILDRSQLKHAPFGQQPA